MTKDEAIAALFAKLADNFDAWEGEEDSVKEEHEDLIRETDALLGEVKAALPAETLFAKLTIHEYAFDVILNGAIRVKAPSEAEAITMLRETLDSSSANLGAWPNGDPVLSEVSYEPGSCRLYEVDGVEVK
jgi:hypothetical protein